MVVLASGGFILSSAFKDYLQSNFDDRLRQYVDAMIGASEIAPEGHVRFTRPLLDQRFVMPYSGWYWQVSSPDHEPFRSRSLWDQQLGTEIADVAFNERIIEREGPDGQLLRRLERDVLLPGSEVVFRFIAAGDSAEIKTEIQGFNQVIIWSLSGLASGLVVAMILQVTFGLSPLRGIRARLAAIRRGRASRLEGEFPPEIEPLVNEMNGLLEHNEEIVARARTQASNMAHALKTPLAIIQNEIGDVLTSEAGETINKQLGIMRRQVEHHLIRARAVGRRAFAGSGVPVSDVVVSIRRTLERLYPDKDLKFEIDCPSEYEFWGDKEDLNEIIGNVLDNAAKWAETRVKVKAISRRVEGLQMLDIVISDDGPGVESENYSVLFERGERLDESVPGTGYGLGIVRDIVGLYGGKIELGRADLGGLNVCICLPAASTEAF